MAQEEEDYVAYEKQQAICYIIGESKKAVRLCVSALLICVLLLFYFHQSTDNRHPMESVCTCIVFVFKTQIEQEEECFKRSSTVVYKLT